MAAYYKFMVEAAVTLGADQDAAEQEMRQVIDFETNIAKVRVRTSRTIFDLSVLR